MSVTLEHFAVGFWVRITVVLWLVWWLVSHTFHRSPPGYGFTWYVSLEFRSMPLYFFLSLSFSSAQRHTHTTKQTAWGNDRSYPLDTNYSMQPQSNSEICFDVIEKKEKKPRANEREGRRIKEKYRVMWLALYNYIHIYWQSYSARKRRPFVNYRSREFQSVLHPYGVAYYRLSSVTTDNTYGAECTTRYVSRQDFLTILFYFFLMWRLHPTWPISQKQPDPACYFISSFFHSNA